MMAASSCDLIAGNDRTKCRIGDDFRTLLAHTALRATIGTVTWASVTLCHCACAENAA